MIEPFAPPELTDDMVATLEEFLPGGSLADGNGEALNAAITTALTQMEQRFAISARTPQSPEQFEALSAVRRAVQGGQLAWQLHQAGRSAN
ncbi:MAG: hypothetical protein FGM20_12430 [Burkholderiaceae bacterium]|nr:hypothetical protein [Burkholderiaceae bacterium]